MSHLAHLNDEQRRAPTDGIAPGMASAAAPLLIIAGAGSGKTTTLAARVAHLVANGADTNRILLLTFSRRAATEMTRRVSRLLASTKDAPGLNLSAFRGRTGHPDRCPVGGRARGSDGGERRANGSPAPHGRLPPHHP